MTRTEAIQKIQATPCLRARVSVAAHRWRSVAARQTARALFCEWLSPGDPDVRRPIDVLAIEAITRRALVAAVAAGEMPGSYLIAAPYLQSEVPTAQQAKDASVGIWHDVARSGYFLSADPLKYSYEGSEWEIQLFRNCEDTIEIASMPIERGLAKRILALAIADGIADKYAIDLARRS